jgi:AcrR family transcriptional regulator
VQLHKRDVVAKAAAILDSYGIADLTMRRLARELDVTPGALYWHFANKQELLGAVADRVLAPACADPEPTGWRMRIEVVPRAAQRPALPHRRRRTGVGQFRGRTVRAVEQISVSSPRRPAGGVDTAPPGAGRPHGAALRPGRHRRRAVPAAVGRRQAELPEHQSVLSGDPSAGFAFGLRLLTDGLAAQRVSTAELG